VPADAEVPAAGRAESRSVLSLRGAGLAAGGLCAVFAVSFSSVRPTNFGGYDEWLVVRLASQGIVDSPHAHRFLDLVWHLPAALTAPDRLDAYLVLHAAYLCLTGVLAFLIGRSLLPGQPAVAFLAGTLAAVWAPQDWTRVEVIQMINRSGVTFAAVLAIALFLESWVRSSRVLLAAAAVLGFLAVQSYEGAWPLLLLGPAALLWALGARWRGRSAWAWLWAGSLLAAGALFLFQFLRYGSYQESMGTDLHPWRLAGRLARLYWLHLGSAVAPPARELAAAPAAAAALAFAAAFVLVVRSRPGPPAGGAAPWPRVAVAGVLLAGLGYGLFAVSPSVRGAARTQYLSAPGIGLLLASLVGAIAGRVPPRWRHAAVGILGAWLVAVATARVAALQRLWDEESYYPAQAASLRRLVDQAPDLAPHTLVVLLDESRTWRATFAFRPAVEFLYRGRATGYAFGAWDYLFPATVGQAGIDVLPSPIIRGPWRSPPTRHRYDELVVVRLTPAGELLLLDDWPPELPPLPPGAAYAPRSRIVSGAPRPPEARILDWGR
jgi:hypothetical protein